MKLREPLSDPDDFDLDVWTPIQFTDEEWAEFEEIGMPAEARYWLEFLISLFRSDFVCPPEPEPGSVTLPPNETREQLERCKAQAQVLRDALALITENNTALNALPPAWSRRRRRCEFLLQSISEDMSAALGQLGRGKPGPKKDQDLEMFVDRIAIIAETFGLPFSRTGKDFGPRKYNPEKFLEAALRFAGRPTPLRTVRGLIKGWVERRKERSSSPAGGGN